MGKPQILEQTQTEQVHHRGGVYYMDKTQKPILFNVRDTGVRKVIAILRGAGNKYIQEFGHYAGRDEKHVCAIMAVGIETGYVKINEDRKGWSANFQSMCLDLGIDEYIFNYIERCNDIGESYSKIANDLEEKLNSGELLT